MPLPRSLIPHHCPLHLSTNTTMAFDQIVIQPSGLRTGSGTSKVILGCGDYPAWECKPISDDPTPKQRQFYMPEAWVPPAKAILDTLTTTSEGKRRIMEDWDPRALAVLVACGIVKLIEFGTHLELVDDLKSPLEVQRSFNTAGYQHLADRVADRATTEARLYRWRQIHIPQGGDYSKHELQRMLQETYPSTPLKEIRAELFGPGVQRSFLTDPRSGDIMEIFNFDARGCV